MIKSKLSLGIGYSPIGERVLIGKQDVEKCLWKGDKIDITNQFVETAIRYFSPNTSRFISQENQCDLLIINVEVNKNSIYKAIKLLEFQLKKLKK